MEAKLGIGIVAGSVKLVPQKEEPPAHFFHRVKDRPYLVPASRESVNGQACDAIDIACGKVHESVLVSWPLGPWLPR